MTHPIPALASADPLPCLPAEVWSDDLHAVAKSELEWLWHGFLARNGVTLLTSQSKSGKTTLLSILLSRLKAGGKLLDRPVAPGKALVVSEEEPTLWDLRNRRLDFANRAGFLFKPFLGKPTQAHWLAFIDHLAQRCQKNDINLVVIDTIGTFFPGRNENNASLMMETLLPLRRFKDERRSVLLIHHPKKGDFLDGQAARGSNWYARGLKRDRRRRLNAFSRFQETPPQLVIELDPAGADFLVHGDFLDDEFQSNWQVLRGVLEDAPRKLTRQQITDAWPADFEKPARTSLYRRLDHAVAQGLLRHEGAGRRNDPIRYWLQESEARWLKNPIYQLELEAEETFRKMQQDPVFNFPDRAGG